ncbi:HEAT repeat domain-containing protein [Methylomonas paludis]|uniref:HEAT repeat domain-containing protein n=1 Tax=Methylomonas paludis TaxID=1173101 RepID=A0A975MLJ5_9GAMM|nr:HEAT repeat domain-containing protein [Methylomonas paludis]QWF69551.1 HEAT repeat domain-containing protein [Methylomonas paludis]
MINPQIPTVRPTAAHAQKYWRLAIAVAAFSCQADEPMQPTLKISQLATSAVVHVQAQQVLLSQLLEQLANTAHLNLHYLSPPANLRVSGDCIGQLPNQVLECLLGSNLNLVVRHSAQGLPEELWVLGGGDPAGSGQSDANLNADLSNNDALLSLTQSQTKIERIRAMANIASGRDTDPLLTKKLLTEAMDDEDPQIRAKAISSYAIFAGEKARLHLKQMLSDKDVDVRLATLVAGYQDPEILNLALGDSSEQVRAAADRLLSRLNNRQTEP